MSIVEIKVIELEEYNEPSEEVVSVELTTPIDSVDGAFYLHQERDDKYLVIAQNEGAEDSELVIKQGNGIQGVVDKNITIGAGKTVYFTLESGCFKNISGENKGKVIFNGPEDIQLAVVKLP